MPESKLSDIIATSLSSIKEIADTNTIIGEPISAGKATIIPVSRVSVGFASGGVDYFGKTTAKPENSNTNGKTSVPQNFGGGGGTGLTVTPICFLIIKDDGNVELLNINSEPHSPGAAGIIESAAELLERSPDIISRLKKIFTKEDKEEKLSGDSPEE